MAGITGSELGQSDEQAARKCLIQERAWRSLPIRRPLPRPGVAGGQWTRASGRLGGVEVPEPAPDRAPEGSPTSPGGRWSHGRSGAVLDWLFRNRQTGGITIAQLPNVPLWIFLATVVLRWVVPTGTWVRTAINWIAVVALGWWALDESLRGVNPWRRALGLGVCVLVVTSAVSSVH